MMRTRDPRIRQTINQISYNLESANESAQEGLYTFSHNYISPCFAAVGNCFYACAAPCLPSREEQIRRRRRGRAEANFDFYDDWDNDVANDSLLDWGTDELDRLLAGSGLTSRGGAEQPRRPRNMSYGTRGARRKSSVIVPDTRDDPTVIPSSSFLGFLERFSWRFGARGIKYRPSAADLQEHPKGGRRHMAEDEPLMENDEDEGQASHAENGRNRSETQSSRETTNSLSSRGDLFPSDDEEDAVPLDDEFALALGSRRGTGLDSEEGGRPAYLRRSASGTPSLGTSASRDSKAKRKSRMKSPKSGVEITPDIETPSMDDFKKEEEQAAFQEESDIVRRRLAAHKLALSRGLDQDNNKSASPSLSVHSQAVSDGIRHQSSSEIPLESTEGKSTDDQPSGDYPQTEPFPPFPLTPPSADYPNESMSILSNHLRTSDNPETIEQPSQNPPPGDKL